MDSVIIEASLSLKGKGSLLMRDLLLAVGARPAFLNVFEGAKITLDTGNLQDLVAMTQPSGLSEEQFRALGVLLHKFANLLLFTTASAFEFGDWTEFTMLGEEVEKLRERILSHGSSKNPG